MKLLARRVFGGKRPKRVVVSFFEGEHEEIFVHARDDNQSLNNFVRFAALNEIARRNETKDMRE